MLHRAAVLAGALVALAACAADEPNGSGLIDGLRSASERPTARVVAIRAYSEGFSTEEQRTDEVPADVVLLDDGLVIADVSEFPDHRYVAVQLTRPEFDARLSEITALEPEDLLIPYDPSFHSSSLMTVIQINDGGGSVEIAVAGLLSHVVKPADVPQFAVGMDLLLTELKQLAVDEGQPYSEDVPSVPGVMPEDPF